MYYYFFLYFDTHEKTESRIIPKRSFLNSVSIAIKKHLG